MEGEHQSMSINKPAVLLVEDNELNLELTVFLLEEAGAQVLPAHDAEEMRQQLTKAVPDIVLMDIQLPGSDGLILTREIRQNSKTSNVPIIALTAHAMRGDRERFLAAGCSGYIPKPIEVDTFVQQVFSFLPGGNKINSGPPEL